MPNSEQAARERERDARGQLRARDRAGVVEHDQQQGLQQEPLGRGEGGEQRRVRQEGQQEGTVELPGPALEGEPHGTEVAGVDPALRQPDLRPGQQLEQCGRGREDVEHGGEAVAQHGAGHPAPDAAPHRPRQPVALGREHGAGREHDHHDIEQHHRQQGQRRPDHVQHEAEADREDHRAEQHQPGEQEAHEQLAALAGVLEPLAAGLHARPEIAAVPRDRPEPPDAERQDGEQDVKQEDAVQLPEPSVIGQDPAARGLVGRLVHRGSLVRATRWPTP